MVELFLSVCDVHLALEQCTINAGYNWTKLIKRSIQNGEFSIIDYDPQDVPATLSKIADSAYAYSCQWRVAYTPRVLVT